MATGGEAGGAAQAGDDVAMGLGSGGHEVRGLVSYDAYLQGRDSKAGVLCFCDCAIV